MLEPKHQETANAFLLTKLPQHLKEGGGGRKGNKILGIFHSAWSCSAGREPGNIGQGALLS